MVPQWLILMDFMRISNIFKQKTGCLAFKILHTCQKMSKQITFSEKTLTTTVFLVPGWICVSISYSYSHATGTQYYACAWFIVKFIFTTFVYLRRVCVFGGDNYRWFSEIYRHIINFLCSMYFVFMFSIFLSLVVCFSYLCVLSAITTIIKIMNEGEDVWHCPRQPSLCGRSRRC